MVLDVADYAYVVNKGKIALEGFPEELLNNEEARNEYLAI